MRRVARRRGQAMTELVILVAALLIGLAWVVMTLPKAVTHHYEDNRDVLSSPL